MNTIATPILGPNAVRYAEGSTQMIVRADKCMVFVVSEGWEDGYGNEKSVKVPRGFWRGNLLGDHPITIGFDRTIACGTRALMAMCKVRVFLKNLENLGFEASRFRVHECLFEVDV